MEPVLVRHIMTTPVVTFFAEQTLPLADDVMHLKRFRHLPVIDEEQRLVGLVSHRDLLRAQISNLIGLTPEQRQARQADVQVKDLMTIDVWRVHPDTRASIAGQTLLDHRFGCLPVVDDTGVLVGIITERDFLRFAIRTLAMTDPG
ncbi:MAG: CBS domain-containing protein [Kofleriaceae bacterium]|jgi:CBS domain-containing membrane protein|nr:CBS domain-containing protein [Kofleriaceae bacterium]MBP6839555.1 CBS domain-containing protein [Kofleriaceae bacterium]MBP9203503.1 CBS domain-containing protein [Kofleriaceae bacterium]